MNAVERIQAAIDKLNKLKAESAPGQWGATGGHDSGSVIVWASDGVGPFTHLFEDLQYGQHAELIVTLHRTIDAQLAILSDAHNQWGFVTDPKGWDSSIRAASYGEQWEWDYSRAIALADAILGPDPH